MGKIPRLGTRVPELIESEQRLMELIERAVSYYKKYGRKKERFGHMIDRKQRAFSDDDLMNIADTFHSWRKDEGYEDISGEFYSASIEEIAKQEYILTPGRYVGTVEEEDDGIPFVEKITNSI